MIRIAHTADIHWRGLSRHDEYRHIFTAFVEDCKKNKVNHIFVGGDIFHTKVSGISPEYIEQLSWWLNSMAEVAEVHLTLGNHDGNLVNLSRQDAVTPIVTALNNKRINLYKKSGIYEFHPGYNWCVFSLFDKENWDKITPEISKINIACYHGQVKGSVTESGWSVEEGVDNDFFEKYDFAFLGDIHKKQMLSYRDGKPWIAFPGTPVQQNYSEELEHGYLLWDISDKNNWDVTFRKLPNPKPYITLEWNGSSEDLFSSANKCPKQSRIRVKSLLPISQGDVQIINDHLKTALNATEVTFKLDHKIETDKIQTDDNTVLEKSNLRSHETVMSLLKSYCKENKYLNIDWDRSESEVKKYLNVVTTSEDLSRGSTWSLRHLKWDNTFAYGSDNEINFANLNGIIGIFGSNRIGKSSIIGTIMYSLFNTTDRGNMKSIYTCNIRKPYCSARSIFDHNGKTYIIERQTTKSANKKGLISASTALNLFKINENEEAEDLCGEQRPDTEKTIRSLIGTPEDFLMTSFSAQGETGAFLLLSSAKRRALLSKFLDLDVFDKMYEISNKELNSLKSRLKNFPEKDWSLLQNKNEDLCKSLQNTIETLSTKICESQAELAELRSQLSSHKEFKPVTSVDVEQQSKKIINLEKQTQDCSQYISSLQSEINSLNEKLNAVDTFTNNEDIAFLKSQLSVIESLEKSIVDLKHSHERELSILKQQQKSLTLLNEVPCGEEYPSCRFIKDAHSDKVKIDDQRKQEEKIKLALENAEKSFKTFDKNGIATRISKYEKAISLAASIKLEISKKETEIAKNKTACEQNLDFLKVSKEKLEDLKNALKNEENYEVVNLRSKIETLSKAIREWDNQKLSAATQHGRTLSETENLNSEKRNRDFLVKEMKVFEMICDAFSKKGLPLMITKKQLPIINREISKILQGIVDFTVELENDEETDSTEIYINYGDSRRIIELCSGMEKTIASIAIRVALTNVSSLPKSDMFIIDEGFGTLDESGVEACNKLLNSLKKYFRIILVITHVDGIKDIADHIIEITKHEKDSNVVFT